jgi:hypothetical protein
MRLGAALYKEQWGGVTYVACKDNGARRHVSALESSSGALQSAPAGRAGHNTILPPGTVCLGWKAVGEGSPNGATPRSTPTGTPPFPRAGWGQLSHYRPEISWNLLAIFLQVACARL